MSTKMEAPEGLADIRSRKGEGRYADLHVHTIHSDSSLNPAEIITLARKKNLAALAITDHDCVDGVEETLDLGRKAGIEVIPAIEMTAMHDGHEVHMLGYCIDHGSRQLQRELAEIAKSRVARIREMVDRLRRYRITLDAEEVLDFSGPGTVGRLHLAMLLYRKGYTRTIQEAFTRYIGDKGPCYVGKFRMTARQAIESISRAGGVPVIAHPHMLHNDERVLSLIREGAQGIEVYHTEHAPAISSRYRTMATAHNLLMTGGSDCHGLGKGGVLLGTVTVPYAWVESLKRAAGTCG